MFFWISINLFNSFKPVR